MVAACAGHGWGAWFADRNRAGDADDGVAGAHGHRPADGLDERTDPLRRLRNPLPGGRYTFLPEKAAASFQVFRKSVIDARVDFFQSCRDGFTVVVFEQDGFLSMFLSIFSTHESGSLAEKCKEPTIACNYLFLGNFR